MKKKTAVALAAALFALPATLSLASTAHAADAVIVQNQPAGVLSLSAQASADVPQDVVNITLFYEQEAKDPGSLTEALNQRADAALKQAKSIASVTARTGSFSIYPSTDRDGRISAWRGRTEIVLESHDFAAASKLAGQMSANMQVGNVAFSLSPEAQRTAEEKLSGQAIASFRQQAGASAQAFGYSGYTIREVNVGRGGMPPRPMRIMSMAAPGGVNAKAMAPVPIEGGTSSVTVDVSGSVQMTR
jgi:predicted secreted protein